MHFSDGAPEPGRGLALVSPSRGTATHLREPGHDIATSMSAKSVRERPK